MLDDGGKQQRIVQIKMKRTMKIGMMTVVMAVTWK